MAALDPRLHDYLAEKVPSGFYMRSARFTVAFNLWSIVALGGRGSETHFQRMQQVFRQYATNADASIRSAALATIRYLEAR
jgi:hypothetical protein